MKSTILIVEDEIRMRDFIKIYLEKEGWHVLEAGDGEEALKLFKANEVDIVILDIMLPKIDGIQLCKRIREISPVYILMLTALEGESCQLKCYESGADDYITKPFKSKILIAKVRRLLERNHDKQPENLYSYQGLQIDYLSRQVYLDDTKLQLAHKEYELLAYLVQHKGIAKTREQILENIWGYDFEGGTRVVDNHVLKLRSKLQGGAKGIKTVIKVGYKYEEI